MRQRGEALECDANEVLKSRAELNLRADTIEVLQTEIESLTLTQQQAESKHREEVRNMRSELSVTRAALEDARAQCIKAMHDAEDLSSSNLKLRVCDRALCHTLHTSGSFLAEISVSSP